MKTWVKKMATSFLGYETARNIKRFISGAPPQFSEADLILAYFRPQRSGVMIDVGAHHGGSFAPYLYKGWTVLAFEPDPTNRAELLRQVENTNRIRVFGLALGDREATGVPFYSSDESSGISGLSAFRRSHREVDRVNLTTLRRICTLEGVSEVQFLKIDTEGHDLFVLRGFPWENIKPRVILCEFEDKKSVSLGYAHNDLGDFLVAHGYEVFLSEWHPIMRYGTVHRWRAWSRYPCQLQDPSGWGNFVAFHEAELSRVEKYLRGFDVAL